MSDARRSKRSKRPPAAATRGPGAAPSIIERYRIWILLAVGLAGVGVIVLVLFKSASAQPWICESLLTPPPAPTASGAQAPAATPLLGFETKEQGHTHVASGTSVTYGFCPPTSGDHYAVNGQAPLPRPDSGYYPPTQVLRPQTWVHNLEHGYVMVLYRGTPDDATQNAIRGVLAAIPPPTDGITQLCGPANRVIAVRFDDMSTPFALAAWNRLLLLPAWDSDVAMAFAQQWQDGPTAPETVMSGRPAC